MVKTMGAKILAADVEKIPPRDCVKTSGKISGGHHATFTRLHASCSRFRDVSVDGTVSTKPNRLLTHASTLLALCNMRLRNEYR